MIHLIEVRSSCEGSQAQCRHDRATPDHTHISHNIALSGFSERVATIRPISRQPRTDAERGSKHGPPPAPNPRATGPIT